MSFVKFAFSVSKITIDVPTIFNCLDSPDKLSALALKNEDNMNKGKH